MSKRTAEYNRIETENDNTDYITSNADDNTGSEVVQDEPASVVVADSDSAIAETIANASVSDSHTVSVSVNANTALEESLPLTSTVRKVSEDIELTVLSDKSPSTQQDPNPNLIPGGEEEAESAEDATIRQLIFDGLIAAASTASTSTGDWVANFDEDENEEDEEEAEPPPPDLSWYKNNSRKIFIISFLLMTGSYIIHYRTYESAVSLVLLLLLHEVGHWVAFRMANIQPITMIFIPWMGAAVIADSHGETAATLGYVGLAGPLFGCVGGCLALAVYVLTHKQYPEIGYIATITFQLNSANLLPLLPMDGGLAVFAIHPVFAGFWFIPLIALCGFAMIHQRSFATLILFVFALFSSWHRFSTWWKNRQSKFYKIHWLHRVTILIAWIGLFTSMMYASWWVNQDRFVAYLRALTPY